MSAIQQLLDAIDDYDDDSLVEIIEDSNLDDVRYLRDMAQEAIDIAREYEDYINRLDEK